MKKWKAAAAVVLTIVLLSFTLTGCSMPQKDDSTFSVTMVTSDGGINDQSFNQSSWEGLQKFAEETGSEVRYIESKQPSDYLTNLDRATDSYPDLIWGIGYTFADPILTIAKANPDMSFAIVDNAYDDTPFNVTGVVFRAEESSFMAGYIAGMSTKTDKVGYVGGMKSAINDQFQYGYDAGVAYAAKERGVKIEVMNQLVESYTDAAKAKAIANKMFSQGADIVFHSAGGAGQGVIESAKDNGKYAIGVDRDQSYLAPDNVLTSALKNVDTAVELVCQEKMDGQDIGGQTLSFGLSDDAVGIPTENKNMDPEVYEKAMEVRQKIISCEIKVPATEEAYNAYAASLGQ